METAQKQPQSHAIGDISRSVTLIIRLPEPQSSSPRCYVWVFMHHSSISNFTDIVFQANLNILNDSVTHATACSNPRFVVGAVCSLPPPSPPCTSQKQMLVWHTKSHRTLHPPESGAPTISSASGDHVCQPHEKAWASASGSFPRSRYKVLFLSVFIFTTYPLTYY